MSFEVFRFSFVCLGVVGSEFLVLFCFKVLSVCGFFRFYFDFIGFEFLCCLGVLLFFIGFECLGFLGFLLCFDFLGF